MAIRTPVPARQLPASPDAHAPEGLRSDDFGSGVITNHFIRSTDPRDKSELDDVLDAVIKTHNSGRLVRAFPGAYYGDLRNNVTATRIPGGMGVVMGDSHPGNFGWLLQHGKNVFGPNDFDDSGYAPVALDAAHYFMTVQDMFGDSALTKRLRDKYVDVIFDRTAAVSPKASLAPDWDALKKDLLDSHTKNDHTRFRHQGDLVVIDSHKDKQALIAAVTPLIDGAEILDTASRVHDTGGSGGYKRYWVLINHKDADGKKRKDILELKQAGPPGVAAFQPKQPTGNARLTLLKTTFFGRNTPDDHVDVKVRGEHFELRRKVRMAGIDLKDKALPKADRDNILLAQVSFLAGLHRTGWLSTHTPRAALSEWLGQSQTTLVQRWKQGYEAVSESEKDKKGRHHR